MNVFDFPFSLRSCECCTNIHTHTGSIANAIHHSSLGSRCVPWLGEGLSMSSPNDPVLCCPLPYRVAPVFVQVVSPPLGWSPLTSFLVIWSPSGDARGQSVVFEAVDMPCPGPFHFSHSVDYIHEFCYWMSNSQASVETLDDSCGCFVPVCA